MPVSATLQAVASVFGWMNTQTQLKNAPDVKKAEKLQAEIDKKDSIKKAISNEDVEATRKFLSG
jgi:hypothetical protein